MGCRHQSTALCVQQGCDSNRGAGLQSEVTAPPLAGILGLDGGFHTPQPGQPEQPHFPQFLLLNERLCFQVLPFTLWFGGPKLPCPLRACGGRGVDGAGPDLAAGQLLSLSALLCTLLLPHLCWCNHVQHAAAAAFLSRCFNGVKWLRLR